MVIRSEQFESFSEAAGRSYQRKIAKFVLALYPSEAATVDMEEFSRQALKDAESIGLRSEMEVASFTGAVLLLGLRFWDDQKFRWAQSILGDKLPFKGERLHECARIESGLASSY